MTSLFTRQDETTQSPANHETSGLKSDNVQDNMKVELDNNLFKLIVNYLPKSFTEEDMNSLFSLAGKVHSCKLMIDVRTGESKGYGFVNFSDSEGAEKAVNTYNGLKLQNKVVRVAFAKPSGDVGTKANLFVSGLWKDIAQEDLEGLFSPYGKIIWSHLLTKGGGLVRFDRKVDAERAIKELNGKVFNNSSPLKVSFAQSFNDKSKTKSEDGDNDNYVNKVLSSAKAKLIQRFSPTDNIPKPSDNSAFILYVSGLPADIEEATLYKMFAPYGAILEVSLLTNPETKKCKGVAFITMSTREDALSAIQSLNGITMANREVRVAFKTKRRK